MIEKLPTWRERGFLGDFGLESEFDLCLNLLRRLGSLCPEPDLCLVLSSPGTFNIWPSRICPMYDLLLVSISCEPPCVWTTGWWGEWRTSWWSLLISMFAGIFFDGRFKPETSDLDRGRKLSKNPFFLSLSFFSSHSRSRDLFRDLDLRRPLRALEPEDDRGRPTWSPLSDSWCDSWPASGSIMGMAKALRSWGRNYVR